MTLQNERTWQGVPPEIRETPSFQNWLRAVQESGNELRAAHPEWIFRSGPHNRVYCWALRVEIYVAAEGRTKNNEVVFSRPDFATVLAYCPGEHLMDTDIVLIREFRSAGATRDGFIHELPSGSDGPAMADPRAVAAKEFAEETGMAVPVGRLRAHGARQVSATLSTHRAHVFSIELSRAEMDFLRTDIRAHGELDVTERTYIEVTTLGAMVAHDYVDWMTLGAAAQVFFSPDPSTSECAGNS